MVKIVTVTGLFGQGEVSSCAATKTPPLLFRRLLLKQIASDSWGGPALPPASMCTPNRQHFKLRTAVGVSRRQSVCENKKKKTKEKREKKRAMAQKMDEAEVTYILTPLQKKTSTTLLTKARRQNNAVFVLSDWFPFLPQLPPIQSNFWHPKCGNNHSFFEVAQAGLHKCSALCADKIQWKTKVKAFDLVRLGECDSCLDVRKSIFYI